ncbi:GOLPH3/VPS74 family protein [Granulicoccus sp. GXG6511]|uniref:GOLPH3/VPS74 family protein n=1 Tax=Granulicoccus sp. GXG6511 TaxID=3381351 RepID=UPI003D7EEF98
MSAPLIAEDLLLLLTHEQKGTVRSSESADFVLAGALLAELTLSGRVRITEKGETSHKASRVTVVDPSPTDDEILDGALARLSTKPDCKPQKAIELLTKKVRRPLQDRLVERGFLRHERSRFVGFNKWPEADGRHEAELRAGLFRVLVQNEEPTVHQATLIALLSALKIVDKVLAEDVSTIDKKAVRKRADELRKQNWTSEAARKAIEAAAATAAIIASTAASAGS